MLPIADSFEHDYQGCEIRYGRGRVAELGDALDERELGDALVVCGSNVGANEDLMDPIREGLGDRLAGVFDRTTPDKRVETAFDLLDRRAEVGADALVAVGGGSSLDIARQATLLDVDGRDLADLRADAEVRGGRARRPRTQDRPRAPRRRDSDDVRGRRRLDRRLTGGARRGRLAHRPADDGQRRGRDARDRPRGPGAVRDDPAVGAGGLGHERRIETPYAADASPVSDATAVHGTRLLRDALPHVAGDRPDDPAATDRAVVGALLVQLGRKISVIHAFGHGFARRYDVQQGTVHAVVAPHVLAYLFDEVDASRRALANGLGVATAGRDDAAIAEDVVSEVAAVRDSLPVPSRLRELDPVDEDDFPAIAEYIADDWSMEQAPPTSTRRPKRSRVCYARRGEDRL